MTASYTATIMRVEDERGVRCVVTQADPVIWISDDLMTEVRSGKHAEVDGGAVLDGDVLTFGTEGEGLGRLCYRLTGDWTDNDYNARWHVAKRITEEDTDRG